MGNPSRQNGRFLRRGLESAPEIRTSDGNAWLETLWETLQDGAPGPYYKWISS